MQPAKCTPSIPCGHDRTCPRCARLRQARVADLAEQLLAGHATIALTIIPALPPDPPALHRHLEAWRRLAQPAACLWTIERGTAKAGLHANLLHPLPIHPVPPSLLAHTEPARAPLRALAAYCSKLSQRPTPTDYPGRTLGVWPNITRALLDPSHHPAVAGATLELLLQNATPGAPPATPPHPDSPAARHFDRWRNDHGTIDRPADWLDYLAEAPPPQPPDPLTRDDYRRLAAKHLPTIMRLVHARQHASGTLITVDKPDHRSPDRAP